MVSIGTLLSALVGGVIGVSSAVLLDRMRWTRDDRLKWAEIRRNTYIEFLAALHDGHIELRAVARRTSSTSPELRASLHEAVNGPRPWKLWHRVALVAPSEVVQRGKVTLELLEHLRDVSGRRHQPRRRRLLTWLVCLLSGIQKIAKHDA